MHPYTVPAEYTDEAERAAYDTGLNVGHGLACHNVPELGEEYFLDADGRVDVDEDNIREVHEALCLSAEENGRCYSPFEFTAAEFNDSDNPEELWSAYEAGVYHAITADVNTYTNEDYGIEG